MNKNWSNQLKYFGHDRSPCRVGWEVPKCPQTPVSGRSHFLMLLGPGGAASPWCQQPCPRPALSAPRGRGQDSCLQSGGEHTESSLPRLLAKLAPLPPPPPPAPPPWASTPCWDSGLPLKLSVFRFSVYKRKCSLPLSQCAHISTPWPWKECSGAEGTQRAGRTRPWHRLPVGPRGGPLAERVCEELASRETLGHLAPCPQVGCDAMVTSSCSWPGRGSGC